MWKVEELSVRLSHKGVLRDLSVDLEAGEVMSVVGPNGSGKTTFLRALTGELPYVGKIRIRDRELATFRPRELAILRGVLPQAISLSFPFTVREVVELGLISGRSGVSSTDRAGLPERALARVGLDGFLGRMYPELSGGEQQRVQLARVLCQVWTPVYEDQPRCLFLDEPVASLDIHHQLTIMSIARDYADRGGCVLAVMHDLNLAAIYSDRLMMLKQGCCAAIGPPKEVLRDDLLEEVFGCRLGVGVAPADGLFVLPQSAADRSI